MEPRPPRAPEGGYMAVELLNQLIEDGIASVKKAYPEGPKLEGALQGFAIAGTLPATYEDFDWAVTQREEAEVRMKQAMFEHPLDGDRDTYTRHRWATLQLDYCRNILLVAKAASGQPLPPGTCLSARAMGRYAGLVGVSALQAP